MSWSKSATGTLDAVKQKVSTWSDEQKATDAGYGMSPDAIGGHQAQVRAAVRAINQFGTDIGENIELTVEAWGHHNGDPRSANGGIKITYSIPAV